MAIKTFISQGDQWNQIISAASSGNASFGVSTWDSSKIDWDKYTMTPVDITWTGSDPWNQTTKWVGGGVSSQPLGCNSFIDTNTNKYDWITNFATGQFIKPAGVRPDVLMGFFGPNLHALLFITDTLTYTMPFMERLGMIWIQHELNKWTAYDRKEFYDFIDNPDATIFSGVTLNKREVQKTMAEAKDE
jgi:hypothetical protein